MTSAITWEPFSQFLKALDTRCGQNHELGGIANSSAHVPCEFSEKFLLLQASCIASENLKGMT